MRYQYHYNIDDMKFSGFYELNKSENIIDFCKSIIFIEFDNKNKMYIDVKGLGHIIIPYEKFIENNNEDLKKYYELSLKLMENKNYIIEKNHNEKVDWFLDCAYIVNNLRTNTNYVERGNYYCYCNINPYILKKMKISSDENIEKYFYQLSILLSNENNIDIENLSCVNNIINILPYVYNIILMYRKYSQTSYYDKIEKLITKYLENENSDTDSD
jgi:hypothetical protein